jgi:hypothetical protein
MTGIKGVVLIADRVVNVDGRLTIEAVGIRVLPLTDEGSTVGTAVLAYADVPAEYIGRTVEAAVVLTDTRTGEPVTLDTDNGPFVVRIGQQVLVEAATVPGVDLPEDFGARVQLVVEMTQGLPLEAGVTYAWDLEIDGLHEDDWTARFHVARLGDGAVPAIVGGKPRLLTEVDGRALIEYVVPPGS